MRYFEDTLGDLRGDIYESFRNIIARMSAANEVTFETPLAPVYVVCVDYDYGEKTTSLIEFLCRKISMDQHGELYFSDGGQTLHEADFDTDALVYMHDEIVATYELDD